MHGRGIASVLLEHLVWQARQRGLAAFTAETLAENSAMLRVFADVGLPAKRRIAGNAVELTFPLPAGQDEHRQGNYLESVASRESRADVASLRPLLQPRSVAVVGPSRRRGSMGRAICRPWPAFARVSSAGPRKSSRLSARLRTPALVFPDAAGENQRVEPLKPDDQPGDRLGQPVHEHLPGGHRHPRRPRRPDRGDRP